MTDTKIKNIINCLLTFVVWLVGCMALLFWLNDYNALLAELILPVYILLGLGFLPISSWLIGKIFQSWKK